MDTINLELSWIIWFFVGLLVFKIPKIKAISSGISEFFDGLVILSIFIFNFETGLISVSNIFLSSLISSIFYLIGANLSRNIHMKIGLTPQLIKRISIYVFVFLFLYSIYG